MAAPSAALCPLCQFGLRCVACAEKYGPVDPATNATIGPALPGVPSNGAAVYKRLPSAFEAKKRADECKAARDRELNTHRPRLEHLVATAVEEGCAEGKYWTVLNKAYLPTDAAQLLLLKTIINELGYNWQTNMNGMTIEFHNPSK